MCNLYLFIGDLCKKTNKRTKNQPVVDLGVWGVMLVAYANLTITSDRTNGAKQTQQMNQKQLNK